MSAGVLLDDERPDERLFEIEAHFHQEDDCRYGALFVTTEFIEDRQHLLVGGVVHFTSDSPLNEASDEEVIQATVEAGLHNAAYDACAILARQMKGVLDFALEIDPRTPDVTITVDRAPAEVTEDSDMAGK
ncbi:hypothetical protein [Micrococcus luteus]|uniref:hypothetical protein n=1 Tax=Micrococcus luteus TaxID=1270 RepID=UPI00288D4BA5|nr:hypothetical protein [Micrococcus luteus]MDT1991435.1 hypothetical protein [Micrococcus luteus]